MLALAFPVALHLQPLPFTHFRFQPAIDSDIDKFELCGIVMVVMFPMPGLQEVKDFRLGEPCPAHGRRQLVEDFGSGFVFEDSGVPGRPECLVTIEAAELVRLDVDVFRSGVIINRVSTKHFPF